MYYFIKWSIQIYLKLLGFTTFQIKFLSQTMVQKLQQNMYRYNIDLFHTLVSKLT